jgi:putative Holliday junction resolvase
MEEKQMKVDITSLRRIIAFDYGELFMGLSLFFEHLDPFPMPYGRIHTRRDLSLILKDIEHLVNQEDINTFVLGIPFLLDGKETSFTKKVRNFANHLQDAFPHIPLHFQDETLSTFMAKKRMEESPRYNFKVNLKEIDAVSATIILEDFITQQTNFPELPVKN